MLSRDSKPNPSESKRLDSDPGTVTQRAVVLLAELAGISHDAARAFFQSLVRDEEIATVDQLDAVYADGLRDGRAAAEHARAS